MLAVPMSLVSLGGAAFLLVWAILPILGLGVHEPAIANPQGIDVTAVEERFNQISSSFSEFRSHLQDNWDAIDEATSLIVDQIRNQNAQLLQLRDQADQLQQEVDYLRELSTLSEEQVEAVVHKLESGSGGKFWTSAVSYTHLTLPTN